MTNKSNWRTVLEGVYFKTHWLSTKVGTALTAAIWITVIVSQKMVGFWILGEESVWLVCALL